MERNIDSTKCACIEATKRKGKHGSATCRNFARREMRVFQDNEHPMIGTGWYWVPVCEKHFWQSEVEWANAKVGDQWRWLKPRKG